MAQGECCDLARLLGPPSISDGQKRQLGQLLIPFVQDEHWRTPAVDELISKGWIGGLILSASANLSNLHAADATQALQQSAQAASHELPLVIGIKNGKSQGKNALQIPQSASHPNRICYAASEAPRLTHDVAALFGRRLASLGTNLLLGLTIDGITESTEPYDVCEMFSDNFEVLAQHVAASTEGLHESSTGVCANISLESSMHEYYRLSSPGEEDNALTLEGSPEEAVLCRLTPTERPDGLFSTFSISEFADPYRASRAQRLVIDRILRQRCAFRGLIMTDCSNVPAGPIHCPVHAPLMALAHGSDMVMLPSDPRLHRACTEAIHAAAFTNILPEETIIAAANRVKYFKQRRLSWRPSPPDSTIYEALNDLHVTCYRSAITALDAEESPLKDLPPSAVILVLTPSMPFDHASTNINTGTPYDPFEALGRAVASYHPRTRHVPYMLSKGLTATHITFLQRVNAVILVLCNGSSAFSETQLEFIDGIQSVIQTQEPPHAGGGAASNGAGERVKRVVLAAGDPRDLRSRNLSGWWRCCCYGYEKGALEAGAEVIMGRRKATGKLPIRI